MWYYESPQMHDYLLDNAPFSTLCETNDLNARIVSNAFGDFSYLDYQGLDKIRIFQGQWFLMFPFIFIMLVFSLP